MTGRGLSGAYGDRRHTDPIRHPAGGSALRSLRRAYVDFLAGAAPAGSAATAAASAASAPSPTRAAAAAASGPPHTPQPAARSRAAKAHAGKGVKAPRK